MSRHDVVTSGSSLVTTTKSLSYRAGLEDGDDDCADDGAEEAKADGGAAEEEQELKCLPITAADPNLADPYGFFAGARARRLTEHADGDDEDDGEEEEEEDDDGDDDVPTNAAHAISSLRHAVGVALVRGNRIALVRHAPAKQEKKSKKKPPLSASDTRAAFTMPAQWVMSCSLCSNGLVSRAAFGVGCGGVGDAMCHLISPAGQAGQAAGQTARQPSDRHAARARGRARGGRARAAPLRRRRPRRGDRRSR